MSFSRSALFIAAIAWSPIPGPSCSRTTIYNHHHRSPIYHRKHQESQPILIAWRRVLSRSRPLEPEEGVPVWRTLESHTRLVLVHGARRRLRNWTHLIVQSLGRVWETGSDNMLHMQNMQHMQHMQQISNMSLYEWYVQYEKICKISRIF